MKFLRLDKKTGSGAPSISSRYAYLVHTDDVAHFPPVNEKGVRLEGSIELKEDCHMIPVYLTNSSQEFSYDIIGDDDEKTYLVKFSGTHPGTELEGLEFSKNMIEQPFLVLLPSCKANEPWKLLGEMTNPLIFTSSHKSAREGSKFNFNFEQRIGSEFIYFSYGGTIVPPPEGGGTDPEIPDGGFDPSKWAKRNADNVEGANVILWREALEIYSKTEIDNLIKAQTVDRILSIGDITATSNTAYLALPPELKNEVIINGDSYSRTVPQQFPYTPVVADQKILIIEAQPDADVFHIVEGLEAPEALEPKYTGLFIARLIVTTTGVLVETGNSTYKQKQESDWRYVNITDASEPIKLALPFDTRGSFYLTKNVGVGIPTIAGIRKTSIAFAGDKYFYGGREGLIFNATGGDVILNAVGVVDNSVFLISNRITPFTLKNNSAVKWKLRGSEIELLPSGGGAELPPGTNGQIYVIDNSLPEKIKPSDRLTTVETEIDAEIVNRALADALKLDKPLAPNNVATKVILGDGSTKNISDFSQVEQIEVGTSGNAQESWKGKLVLITASCTITIPTALSNNWSCEIATLAGVTLTWAITSPKTWLFGTPPTFPEKSMCTVSQRGTTNDIMLFGGYGI